MNESATNSTNYTTPYTNTTSPSTESTGYPVWVEAILGCFLATVILISVIGNVLVCVAILTDRKLRKASNLFLISLAISDLVVSTLVMPFALVNDILQYWPFSETFCDIWMSFDVLSATASILNLCAISLDRYIHMKNPFGYERWMSHKKCIGFICAIWLASIIISFPPIISGLHEHSLKSETLTTTTPSVALDLSQLQPVCQMNLSFLYASISSSISFYIPCIVMVTIYIKMYRLARYHARKIKETRSCNRFDESNKKPSENKALFTLGMIMGLFLLCWMPFFILNLVSSLYKDVPGKLFVAVIWVGYLNSTMNPIIYSKFNADFRAAFKRILLCKRCRRRADPYDTRPRHWSSRHIGLKELSSNGKSTVLANGTNGVELTPENSLSNNNQHCQSKWESKSLLDNDGNSDHQLQAEKKSTNNDND